MRYFSITITLFLLSFSCFGGTLKGKVTDEKGERLPYATIYIEGTTLGVNANGNGDFELVVSPGLYKVVCQYVGYKQSVFNLNITGNETLEHSFILTSESLNMKEVVVHANAEDPAYPIIRNAIKRRKFHLDQVRSFQTALYFKGVMRSRNLPDKFMGQKVKSVDMGLDTAGKGVLYLTEEDAEYFTDGDKEKTVIHSVHESGNKNGVGFSQFPPVITFYNNNVEVLGKNSRGFISPISDNALNYYRYKYLGEFIENGHTINKIQVIQKRAYEPCFNGTIYIVDDEWAIHSLNMTLVKESGMDMLDTIKIDQLFLPLEKDNWVIKSQVLFFAIKFLAFDVTGSGVAVYNKQKVNEEIPDSVFSKRIVSSYDKTANKKDTSYWQNRPVPLQTDEQRDFVRKDSINKIIESPAYRDSIRRKGNKFSPMGLLTGGSTFSGKEYKNVYSTNSVLIGLGEVNMLNYNIVEGYNIAPKLSWRHMVDTGKFIFADVAARYGFANTHFNSIGRVYYVQRSRELLNRLWLFGVEGGKYVFQYDPDNSVNPFFNTYSALFFRQNDIKLYERWDADAYVRRNYGNGLSWFIKTSYQQRLPLTNSTDQSIIPGNQDGFTNNAPSHLLDMATAWEKHDAVLIDARISYKPGITFTQYPDYKVANSSSWPRLTLIYDKGVPGILNSKVDYDKWRFNIQDDVNLRLLGVLKYNFVAGGFLNSTYVSFPDLMHLYGNRGIGYASPYLQSFQFAQYYDFSNKDKLYGEAHIEYHLNGLLSNKIPLLRQARFYLLFGGNAFYGSNGDYYTEAFVGIDNIGWKLVRLLRVDFVQSWDSFSGHNSGVRFGLNLPGVSTTRNNPTNSEW